MLRMRFLRMAVRWRRFSRRPRVAASLTRVRRAMPYAASVGLNLLLILALALGYTSFVARGVVTGGIGERVVSVTLLDRLPEPEDAQDVKAEDTEADEDAEIGAEALPEGNAIEDGEIDGERTGDEAPEEELGQQQAVAQAGVETPTVTVPEVDAGAGRPDGIIGVDCYEVFTSNQDKALECAGREILSGWRAEVADLGEDWQRFARMLGTADRQIRYGPLRGRADPRLSGYDPRFQVPPEVARAYEEHLARLRREQQIREFGRVSESRQRNREQLERDMDAATYEPVTADLPD